jgi:hypothetical protein
MHDEVRAVGRRARLDECIYPRPCNGLCKALGDQRRTLEKNWGYVRLLTAVHVATSLASSMHTKSAVPTSRLNDSCQLRPRSNTSIRT